MLKRTTTALDHAWRRLRTLQDWTVETTTKNWVAQRHRSWMTAKLIWHVLKWISCWIMRPKICWQRSTEAAFKQWNTVHLASCSVSNIVGTAFSSEIETILDTSTERRNVEEHRSRYKGSGHHESYNQAVMPNHLIHSQASAVPSKTLALDVLVQDRREIRLENKVDSTKWFCAAFDTVERYFSVGVEWWKDQPGAVA